MPETILRQSPIHSWLAAQNPEWHVAGDWQIAIWLQDPQSDQESARKLGLCDLSGPEKLGLKGPDAADWLAQQNIEIPDEVYQLCRLSDGGVVVRVARDEFLLESGLKNETVPALAARLDLASPRRFRVEHQEATFVLVGERAMEVLAQTCGIDFRQRPLENLIYTRVAGVSCGVLPELINAATAYRLWVDCSYAADLWETLLTICEDLDGQAVGAGALFGELR